MRIKKQFIKLAVILSSILLIISSLNNVIILEDIEIVQNNVLDKNNENNNLIPPKSSGSWTLTSIYIDNTDGATHGTWAQCTANYDWCSFIGGYYVLENITLIGSFGTGIRIANSIVPFRIKNCTILQKETGIKFESVSNGEIINCHIEVRYWGSDYAGIHLQNSDYNNIYDNIIEFVPREYFYMSSSFKGIRGDNSDYLDINGNVIKGTSTGIGIYDSINSFLTDNTISSCVIGIGCEYVQHTDISFNQIFGDAWYGIELNDNDNLTIEENFIVETNTGIGISYTHNSLFKENILIDNKEGFGDVWYYSWGYPGENNTYINNVIINSIENEDFKDKSKTISSYDPSILYGLLIITSGLITIIIFKKWKVLGKKK
ncbi:MAG: hypothetical protein EU548_06090 [Promethearchaeota archaeon]|nr:MAG: hypothetical protein EU548_06090 [Candidatus Lokiarchaeota archaeon]